MRDPYSLEKLEYLKPFLVEVRFFFSSICFVSDIHRGFVPERSRKGRVLLVLNLPTSPQVLNVKTLLSIEAYIYEISGMFTNRTKRIKYNLYHDDLMSLKLHIGLQA